MNWLQIANVVVVIFGVLGLILAQITRTRKGRIMASSIGLAGQPFWFVLAFNYESVGMILTAMMYTFAWALGLITAIQEKKQ